MSQRMGMADGRCFTIATASGLVNDYIMDANGIPYVDNYSYRQLLQNKGPAALRVIQDLQRSAPNGSPLCQACDRPLLKMPNTF